MVNYKSPSNFYNLQIPTYWKYEEGDDNVLFIYKADDGEGALQISSFLIPKDYAMNIKEELLEFSSQYVEHFSIDDLSRFVKESSNSAVLEIDEEDRFWVFHVLFEKNKLLFITYNCEKKNKSIERLIINQIIQSIKIN